MSRKILVLLALAAVTAVATAANSQGPAGVSKSITVEECSVTLWDDVEVPAADSGTLMKLYFKEGQSVEQGALLADIDNREILAKQAIAKGELAAATQQAESRAEIEVAEKAIGVAKEELAAIQEIRLKNKAAIPETEVRKSQFQLDRALAQLKQAENENLVAHLTAEVKQAQVNAAEIEIDRRQIKALFKGEVDRIIKMRGEWVQAGEPILRLVALDRVRVNGAVKASLAAPVDVLGKPVVITFYTAGNKQHTVKGTVGFASSVIDGTSDAREFRIWAEVENEKVVDPLTKQSSWKIQPGSPATMTIDLTPPAPPKPPTATKTDAGKGGKSPTSSGSGSKVLPTDSKSTSTPSAAGKVDALKPPLSGAGEKSTESNSSGTPRTEGGKKDDGKTPSIQATPAKPGDDKNTTDAKSAGPVVRER